MGAPLTSNGYCAMGRSKCRCRQSSGEVQQCSQWVEPQQGEPPQVLGRDELPVEAQFEDHPPVRLQSKPLPEDIKRGLNAAAVDMPSHYARFKIEPIHFAIENNLDGLEFNINKYYTRAPYKHKDFGLQDYLKAIRYIIMKAKHLRGRADWAEPYTTPGMVEILEKEITGG